MLKTFLDNSDAIVTNEAGEEGQILFSSLSNSNAVCNQPIVNVAGKNISMKTFSRKGGAEWKFAILIRKAGQDDRMNCRMSDILSGKEAVAVVGEKKVACCAHEGPFSFNTKERFRAPVR